MLSTVCSRLGRRTLVLAPCERALAIQPAKSAIGVNATSTNVRSKRNYRTGGERAALPRKCLSIILTAGRAKRVIRPSQILFNPSAHHADKPSATG